MNFVFFFFLIRHLREQKSLNEIQSFVSDSIPITSTEPFIFFYKRSLAVQRKLRSLPLQRTEGI